MNDSERTQEWLLRTQEIRRVPAVRGGVAVDHAARRQTATCVGAAAAALLMLLSLAPRLWPATAAGDATTRRLPGRPAAAPMVSRGPIEPPAPPVAFLDPPVAVSVVDRPSGASPTTRSPATGRWEDFLPARGSAPPPAPTWLDGASKVTR